MCLESGSTSGQEIEIQNTSVVLVFAETVDPEIAGAIRSILINSYLKQRR